MHHISEFLAPTTVRKNCSECGAPFELAGIAERFAAFVTRCEACTAREDERRSECDRVERARLREKQWEKLCPPKFPADLSDGLPRRDLVDRVLAWKYGPRGLVLHGASGFGKSYAAWRLLRREFDRGRCVQAIGITFAAAYGHIANLTYGDVAPWMNKYLTAELLLTDDIFKVPMTDKIEAALLTIVALRTEQNLPIILTLNDTSETLKQRLSSDRAEPLIRRLMEFNEMIPFV